MRLSEFKGRKIISECVNTIPLTDEDFDELKERLNRPIPAEIAETILFDVLNTSDLTEEYKSMAQNSPNRDIRPLVVKWLELNMPDQIHRFSGVNQDPAIVFGTLSPLHGYDIKDAQ